MTSSLPEGYGDLSGDIGGYGEEDFGYGDPSFVEGWYVIEVLEEGFAASVVSGIAPDGVGSNKVRENGGDLVVVGSTGPIGGGPYKITIRPTGGTRTAQAYSGVLGQGWVIYPDLNNNRFAFVAPYAFQLGRADLIIDRPGGQVVVEGLLDYVPYSDRSGVKLQRSLWPDIYDRGDYAPTVS